MKPYGGGTVRSQTPRASVESFHEEREAAYLKRRTHMCRTMRQSVLVLSALIIGLVVSIPGSVLARATITAVEGLADLSDGVLGGEVWSDSAGNMHFQHFSEKGNFSLQGDEIDINGKQILVLNGKLNPSLTGPFSGTFTVSTIIEGQDTVIWEGRVHGQVVELIFTGRITAHGRGPFAGMLLHLGIQEDTSGPEPNSEIFNLTGWLLDPHGQ